MFGMLDYRAHKLYWLLSLPLGLLNWCATIAIFFASCWLASSLVTNVIARFALAYIAMQVFCIFFVFFCKGIVWCFDSLFYFFIDIEPADGRTPEQARAVLKGGETAILLLKPFSKWSNADFEDTIRRMGWIARIFFPSSIRRRQQVLSKKAKERATEGNPEINDLSDYEIKNLMKTEGIEQPWYETVLCKGYVRTSVIVHIIFVGIFIVYQK